MKHRRVGIDRIRLINSDGHAIGLDIGATSVRAAVLAPATVHGRATAGLHGLASVGLPAGAVVNGVVADTAAVTRAIRQLWQGGRFDCRNVILGVTNQQVVVREVELPNLPAAQRAQALPFQAREIIALPIDQAVLDFIPMGEADPERDTVPGLLIAAPRGPVAGAVAAVQSAGLKVARVDLSCLALLRALGTSEQDSEAIVDVGAHLTSVVIHECGRPRVIRTVARGGAYITEQLAARTGLELDEAERVKREAGLGPESPVADALREIVRPFIAEIRSTLRLVTPGDPARPVARVHLTGGTARMPGLLTALAEALQVPVADTAALQHIGNRWAMKRAKHLIDESSATAVSVGLAMGAAA